jgi:hypothetical protein
MRASLFRCGVRVLFSRPARRVFCCLFQYLFFRVCREGLSSGCDVHWTSSSSVSVRRRQSSRPFWDHAASAMSTNKNVVEMVEVETVEPNPEKEPTTKSRNDCGFVGRITQKGAKQPSPLGHQLNISNSTRACLCGVHVFSTRSPRTSLMTRTIGASTSG